jgi:hypothetical protein
MPVKLTKILSRKEKYLLDISNTLKELAKNTGTTSLNEEYSYSNPLNSSTPISIQEELLIDINNTLQKYKEISANNDNSSAANISFEPSGSIESTDIQSAISELDTDITELQNTLDEKQSTLISGTNIKTINNESILGNGNITISGSNSEWGNIAGTLSNQTDLQTALNSKSDTSHTHTTTEVAEGTNLYYTESRVSTWWANIKTLASTFTGLITLDNVLIKRVYFTPIAASFSGTYTADLSLANIFILTMTGNGVLDFSNAQVGSYTWIITTGGNTLTLAVGKFQGEFDVSGKALISGIYDGSKMVITSIKNLTDI